jgi:plastocyanin
MHTTRRALLGSVGTALATGLAGCTGGGTDTPGDSLTVMMVNTQFDPRNARVAAGGTVTWTNEDDSPHTVTSASENWQKDAEVTAGGQTTHTFSDDGIYDVYCTFHGSADLSGMSMKIAVGSATIDDPLGEASDGNGGGGY